MKGYICGPKVYEYKGVTIEVSYSGPWPVNKAGDLYKRLPAAVAAIFDEFWHLPECEQDEYRTGGGCQRFGDE